MRSFFLKVFIHNWPRKLISLILGVIVWFVVSQSMVTTKTISNIPVRLINIPEGKTIDGLQSNGLLSKRVTLTIFGNKNTLEDLTSNDFEVVLDSADHSKEWIATISKKNLISLNPDFNLQRHISKVSHKNFIIKLSNLVTESIPVVITQPIGQAPKGYQFLDVWPYHLSLSVSGPEDVIKEVKNKGVKLTFNLNDISQAQLDNLLSTTTSKSDIVSFFVPNHWKMVSIPMLSSNPLKINDKDAKFLRIDFVKSELLPITHSIPVNLFFPPKLNTQYNPQKVSISHSDVIESQHGLKVLSTPLYAKGVSEMFMEIISDMLEIVVIVSPKPESDELPWSLQIVNSRVLEDRYVSLYLSDVSDEGIIDMQPKIREEYLRNRFRSYVSRLKLYTTDFKKLKLVPHLAGQKVNISDHTKDESPAKHQ